MPTFTSGQVLTAQRSELALPMLQLVARESGLPFIPQFISNWSRDTQQVFRSEWDIRRTPRPSQCGVCKVTTDEYLKRFIWHHHDESLRGVMKDSRDRCYSYLNPDLIWQSLYREFARAVAEYYLVPVEETTFMCSSCHIKHHHSSKG